MHPVPYISLIHESNNMLCLLTGAGRTKSVFDIFREDVVNDVESTPVENTSLRCGGVA